MVVRGIRGATTVQQNDETEILAATKELMEAIIAENDLRPEEIGCIYITVTQDLDQAFPAVAIRNVPGWSLVPLMCAQEIPVKNSLQRCIRLMLLYNTTKAQDEIVHVYLNEARQLRPDLTK